MEGITIPAAVPDDLKKACDSLIKRATEMKRSEPVISYWCCFAAAQNALKVPSRSGQGTMYLMSLLDTLEEMKSALAGNEAVTNEAAGSAYVENFALRIFVSADTDERRGKADRSVIQRFAVSTQFMEVLRCFEGGLSEEMEQKRKYALWKAADLSKCLREGRKPIPGPPLGEEDELAALAALTPPADTPLGSGSNPSDSSSQRTSTESSRRESGSKPPPIVLAPAAGTPEAPRPPRSDSGLWSTVATPGVDGDSQPWPLTGKLSPADGAPSGRATAPAKPGKIDMPEKNVRFTGPDGAPLSPAETFASVTEFSEVGAPPPSEVDGPATFPAPPPHLPSLPTPTIPGMGGASSSNSSKSPSPPMSKSASLPKSTSPPAPPPVVKPAPPTAKPAPPPAPKPVRAVPAKAVPPPAPAAAQPAPGTRLGRRETELVQKHARWAISALDYDDYETARKELLLALSMLPPA